MLAAGTDLDRQFLRRAPGRGVRSGAVTEPMLDSALTNLVTVQMRLGMLQPSGAQTPSTGSAQLMNTEEHQKLALDSAQVKDVKL